MYNHGAQSPVDNSVRHQRTHEDNHDFPNIMQSIVVV